MDAAEGEPTPKRGPAFAPLADSSSSGGGGEGAETEAHSAIAGYFGDAARRRRLAQNDGGCASPRRSSSAPVAAAAAPPFASKVRMISVVPERGACVSHAATGNIHVQLAPLFVAHLSALPRTASLFPLFVKKEHEADLRRLHGLDVDGGGGGAEDGAEASEAAAPAFYPLRRYEEALARNASSASPAEEPASSRRVEFLWTYRARFWMTTTSAGASSPSTVNSAQLASRRWQIQDPLKRGGEVQVVEGPGVIGLYPKLLAEGDSDVPPINAFEYNSVTTFLGPSGLMWGSFSFVPGSLDHPAPGKPPIAAEAAAINFTPPAFIYA